MEGLTVVAVGIVRMGRRRRNEMMGAWYWLSGSVCTELQSQKVSLIDLTSTLQT